MRISIFGKFLAAVPALCLSLSLTAYNDHRGHNLDSLERVVAPWTPDAVDGASMEDRIRLNRAYRDLMLGYEVLNGEKSLFYARKAFSISRQERWAEASADAARHIGQYFYARERYDSAMVWFRQALMHVEEMASGAVSPTNPEGYDEKSVDDARSALYGAVGNLYNMMDSLPQAMDWYAKAGAIFEKHGWRESSSILYYNIGETWMDEGDIRQAGEAYGKALEHAQASGDSLMIMNVYKGLGRMYMEDGKPWKALPYLREAQAFYAAHPDDSPDFRTENLEFMSQVLSRQKRQLLLSAGAAVLLLLLLAAVWVTARRLRRVRKERAETAEVMEETLDDWRRNKAMQAVPEEVPQLSAREKEVLDLLSKGYTAPQIGEALHLSHETIRWYRKKLIVKFDVANTPELISRAKETGCL